MRGAEIKKPPSVETWRFMNGTPGAIRTPDLRNRNPGNFVEISTFVVHGGGHGGYFLKNIFFYKRY